MTMCSWTGGSRSEVRKVAFKIYERTIQLFFDIIRYAHPTFTEIKMQQFFQCVIKNSKSRCQQNGPKRKSSGRRRGIRQDLSQEASLQLNEYNVVVGDTVYSIDEYSEDDSQFMEGEEVADNFGKTRMDDIATDWQNDEKGVKEETTP